MRRENGITGCNAVVLQRIRTPDPISVSELALVPIPKPASALIRSPNLCLFRTFFVPSPLPVLSPRACPLQKRGKCDGNHTLV